MKIVKQLALFLENKPGTLAAVCRALAARNVSIYAMSVSDAIDHAVVRMVVSHPDKALHLLGDHGVLVVERDVLMIRARNRPGEMAAIAQRLAQHKMNIDYAYTATDPKTERGVMILRTENTKKAARVLKAY
ncbi:ACT domain-containing protein [bacterium]|nr:ACT domain-containing protein [bacterium]